MDSFSHKLHLAQETAILFCTRRFIDPHDRAATVAYIRDLSFRLTESQPTDLKSILEMEYRELCLKNELGELGRGETRIGKKIQALSAFAEEYNIKLSEPNFADVEAMREAKRESQLLKFRIVVSDEVVKDSLQDIAQEITQEEPNHALFMALSLLLQNSIDSPVVDMGKLVETLPLRIKEKLPTEYRDSCQRLYKDEALRAKAIADLDDAKVKEISKRIVKDLKTNYHILSSEEFQSIVDKVSNGIVADIGNITFQGTRLGSTRRLYLTSEQRDAFQRNCKHFAKKFEDGTDLAAFIKDGDYLNLFPHAMKDCLSVFMRRVLLEAGYELDHVDSILTDAPLPDLRRR